MRLIKSDFCNTLTFLKTGSVSANASPRRREGAFFSATLAFILEAIRVGFPPKRFQANDLAKPHIYQSQASSELLKAAFHFLAKGFVVSRPHRRKKKKQFMKTWHKHLDTRSSLFFF